MQCLNFNKVSLFESIHTYWLFDYYCRLSVTDARPLHVRLSRPLQTTPWHVSEPEMCGEAPSGDLIMRSLTGNDHGRTLPAPLRTA